MSERSLDAGYNNVYRSDGRRPLGSPSRGDLWGVDPEFVDAAGGDFRLQLLSPMIDAGTDVDVTTDFAGKARPRGGGHDIGAFESVIELVEPEGVGTSPHTFMPGTISLR